MINQLLRKLILPQWLAGVGVTMLIFHLGLMGGWSSPTLARLTAPDSSLSITTEQGSWVASLANLSRFFGAIFGAIATNYLGSKKSILLTLIPIASGWFIVIFADAVEWLYFSRLSSGLGLGMAFTTFPLYIGEVSMPEIRGALISLATLGAPFGQVIASVCGSNLSISTASVIYFILAMTCVVLFLWLPESPHHLMKIGDREGARKSIDWYRSSIGVDEELEAVDKFVTSEGSKTFAEKLQYFKTPAIKRATLQIIILFAFMQTSGLNIIMFFMETILIRAKFTLIEPSDVVIYVNICSTISSGISIFLIDRCGRRFLLLLSSTGTAISMIGLMCHFLLLESEVDLMNLQWLPMVSVLVFMISFFIGLMPVPNAVLSETFPANTKCIAACIAILIGAALSFISAKTYQPMVDTMGDTYVFLSYGFCSILVIPYTLFVLRETKGKSLQQIQDELLKM